MRVSKEFASRYLKPVDIENGLTVEISHTARETVGRQREQRWVLYFVDQQKPLILNSTNSHVLADAFGDDSDEWGGAIVTLYVEETDLGPGIRIRPSPAKGWNPHPRRERRDAVKNEPNEIGDRAYIEVNPPPHTGDGIL